jgi:hypothetical protein
MLTLPITRNEKMKDWSTIQNIAYNNGFPPIIIHKLRHQIENITKSISQTTTTPKAWVTFTFNSPAVYKITNLFRNTGLNIAYKPSNTIRHLLQPKHNFDPFTQLGIIIYIAYLAIGCMWGNLVVKSEHATRNIYDTFATITQYQPIHNTY